MENKNIKDFQTLLSGFAKEKAEYIDAESEELQEALQNSDMWFKTTIASLRIINNLAQDPSVVDDALRALSDVAADSSIVLSMFSLLQTLNRLTNDPDAFDKYLKESIL